MSIQRLKLKVKLLQFMIKEMDISTWVCNVKVFLIVKLIKNYFHWSTFGLRLTRLMYRE